MTKSIDFYFDFVSPYTFLAHKRIVVIKKNENVIKEEELDAVGACPVTQEEVIKSNKST